MSKYEALYLQARAEIQDEQTTYATMSRHCIRFCGYEARLKIIDRINKISEPAEIPTVKVNHKSR